MRQGLKGALAFLAIAGQTLTGHASPARSGDACVDEARPDRLQGLTPEGDLVLASSGPAKLSGIRLPDVSRHRDEALAWLRARVERTVLVQGAENRDRWNRLTALIRPADPPDSPDFAKGLVEAGLALVDPGADGGLCQPALLALEDAARKQGLGLWADDRYKPIDVAFNDHLRDRVGRFVLVEGLVRSVGERPQTTYLNFGGHWAEDFTIIIPRKTWKLMADRGLGAAALKGRRIRARGILQAWQGTALTIVIPDMIERLEDKRLAR